MAAFERSPAAGLGAEIAAKPCIEATLQAAYPARGVSSLALPWWRHLIIANCITRRRRDTESRRTHLYETTLP